jgi:uncharacterized protein YggE
MARSLSAAVGCGCLSILTTVQAFAQVGEGPSSPADASREGRFPAHTISVSGHGRVSAAPDQAEVQLGVVSQAQTAKQALAANNEAMDALHKVLKERGIAAKDIQTTQVSITPQYLQPTSPPRPGSEREVPRIIGYQVDNSVRITARDLNKLGAQLDAAVNAGANQVFGVTFRIADSDKCMDEARKRAMADAHRKAEIFAGEAGVVLGAVIRIQEGGSSPWWPAPTFGATVAAAAPAPIAAPIAPGEQELQVWIEVTYALKAPK